MADIIHAFWYLLSHFLIGVELMLVSWERKRYTNEYTDQETDLDIWRLSFRNRSIQMDRYVYTDRCSSPGTTVSASLNCSFHDDVPSTDETFARATSLSTVLCGCTRSNLVLFYNITYTYTPSHIKYTPHTTPTHSDSLHTSTPETKLFIWRLETIRCLVARQVLARCV